MKKSLGLSLIVILALLIGNLDLGYGFHVPWDRDHDTFGPGGLPNDRPRDPRCNCNNAATGDPVFLASGRYIRTVVDLSIPARGMPLEVSRTYNTQDRYNGLFGYGWVFDYSTRLILVSDGLVRYAIVRMPDGRRFSYRQIDSMTFAPPPGDFSTLTKRADGTYQLLEKDGRKQAFDADGNLTAIVDRYGSRLSLAYTADGFISSVSDGTGRNLRFTLGVNGKIASITDYTSRTITYSYDSAGHLAQVRDTAGNVTTYTYDAKHNMTSIAVRISDTRTDVIAQISYDGQGRVTRVLDAEGDFSYAYGVGETRKIDNALGGATWVYRYDSRGILTEIRDPLGGVESRIYDANGLPTQLTDKSGNITRYEYDEHGNVVTRIDPAPLNYNTRFTYEPVFNRVTSRTDPRGVVTRYAYSIQGNLLRMTEAVGLPEQRVTSYEYDPFGYVTQITYPDGTAERFTYDPAGRLLTRTDALSNTLEYTYDSLSRLQCRKDPNNQRTCYEYDVLDRVITIIDALNNRTQFTYDAVGNILTATNAIGEVTRFTYDAFRRPRTITDHYGNVVTYAYDAHGNRTSELDPNGKMVYYKYDALDRLVGIVQKVGETLDRITGNDTVTEFTYDRLGNQTSGRDPNGNTVRFGYDALQRLTSLTSPNGLTLAYTYDEIGNITRIRRSDGYFRAHGYDKLNRLIQESDPVGTLATYTYDAMGRRIRVTDGNGNSTRYSYDATGRLTAITDPLERVTRLEYDGVGNLRRRIDREGRARSFTYDALNRRATLTDAIASVTTFSYDAIGRTTTLRDGNGNTTTFTYGNAGTRRVIRQTYADGAFIQWEFDGAGNRVRRVDPNGAATTYTYDDLNRLIRRSYPGGNEDVFTFDKGSRMLTATNTNVALAFEYDSVGRVTRATQNGIPITYSYNDVGTERTLTYPGGRRVKEAYDERYRLLRVENILPVANTLAQFTHDVGNRLTSQRLLNNVVTDFSYDANENITQLVAQLSGSLLVGFEYRFDREDNRLSAKRLHDLARSERYGYDPVYRLDQLRRGVIDASGEIPAPATQSAWTLDRLGNWSRRMQDGVAETRTHNALNQITSVADRSLRYDANGNLVDDGVNAYAYDYENRLTQVTRRSDGQVLARFRYDALKRRVAKEVGGTSTTYFYDGVRLIEEQQNGVPSATYVFGRAMADVLEMERGGRHYYHHANSLGTIDALSDAMGAVVERYLYDTYGNVRFFNGAGRELPASAVGNPYLFTAQRWDAEVGLYDYRARPYHPALGRFLQRDPMGYTAGMNLQAYVDDNPINWGDPFGLGEGVFDALRQIGLGALKTAAEPVLDVADIINLARGADTPLQSAIGRYAEGQMAQGRSASSVSAELVGTILLRGVVAVKTGGMSEVMLATYGIAKDIHEAASGTASADELLQDVGANLFTIAVVEGLTAPKAGPSRVSPPARPAMMPNASNFSSPRNLNNAKPTRNACPPNAARRPSFRKATTERALEEAPVGPDGGKVCPTCEKPIGRGTIERGGRLRRDFDVDHTGKTWAQRVSEMRQNITRREVIEEYQRDVRAQCPDCNQSHAFEPKR